MTDAERQELKDTSRAIAQLSTDVAVLKHSNEKIIEPALKTINEKLDKLNFYTKAEVDAKIKALNKKRWYENTLSAAVGVIMSLVVVYFFNLFTGR